MLSQSLAFIIGFHLYKTQMFFGGEFSKINFLDRLKITPPPSEILLPETPEISAKSYLAVDLASNILLISDNIHTKMKIASLTKLMTAIIILEENKFDEKVSVGSDALNIKGSRIWLKENEIITVKNLLYGVFVSSANDAARALAVHNAGSIRKFVGKMNKRAQELGLKNTYFDNPTGIDSDKNFSTARDVLMMVLYLRKKPFFRLATEIQKIDVYSYDKKIKHRLENTNKLLKSYLNVVAGKTGTTEKAGQCLATVIKTPANREIAVIALGSKNRWLDVKSLIEAVYYNYPEFR